MCCSLLEFKRAAVGTRQQWMNVAVRSFDTAANKKKSCRLLFSNAVTLDHCVSDHPQAAISSLLGGFLHYAVL